MSNEKPIVVISGATSGIGYETARLLAHHNLHLVLACRNLAQAEAVRTTLITTSGNEQIETINLDLASLAAIHACAAELAERYPRIDTLINNAGTFRLAREESTDGFELTLATNYLGPFLFTRLLLPLLHAAPTARIVNVGSDAHKYARLDLNNLQLERGYAGFKAYARSKLAQVYATQELAAQLDPARITVNVVHPGHVDTNIWNLWPEGNRIYPLMTNLMRRFMLTAAEAAHSVRHLATAPELQGISGAYFDRTKRATAARHAHNPALQRHLWHATIQLIERWTAPTGIAPSTQPQGTTLPHHNHSEPPTITAAAPVSAEQHTPATLPHPHQPPTLAPSTPIADLATLLSTLNPYLHPGSYVFTSVPEGTIVAPAQIIASIHEAEGQSLVITEAAAHEAKLPILARCAWITLTVTSDLHAVGLTAAIATALRNVGLSCNIIAGAYHDHLFIPIDHAEQAMETLAALQQQAAQR
ncbi:ACT domain-containing protein [Candidatus Chloroploca asiatica]|uniref:DUF2241 domain-containing protein n=1 Tax=Candidatus Chloroploca asiatica TaxID=1506545 RepID=A0A2H3KQ04_9CHLR|nr:ACT domain-containing protein [Candidatus Chloroploca asiatica]PDW00297.1 hypothetical protein A9Q02_21875 [Candidatus Chloroploca asiatica]